MFHRTFHFRSHNGSIVTSSNKVLANILRNMADVRDKIIFATDLRTQMKIVADTLPLPITLFTFIYSNSNTPTTEAIQ